MVEVHARLCGNSVFLRVTMPEISRTGLPNRFALPLRRLLVAGVIALLTGCADGDTPVRLLGTRGPADDPEAAGLEQAVAVITAKVTQKDFDRVVEAIGTARANEAVDVTAKVSSRVAAIHFREGQEVQTGAVLVELDSEEARAKLAEAEAALKESRSQYKRSRELYQTQALSDAQLDQIQATLSANEARVAAARSLLNDLTIRAPFAGRVGLRNISIGSFVSPGTVITTLDDMRIIKLDFSVPELFLPILQEGQPVEARSSAYPDRIFKGVVSSIDSRVDPTSRSVIVRAKIDNPDRLLRPGMFMTVRLMRQEPPALIVPEEALVPQGDRQYVFVVRNGRAERVEVQTGRRRPGEVEILKGLTAGELVVTEGTQKVRDGTPVKIVEPDGLAA
jgi:membrane fusion protein (multidrug efflux system)